MTPAHLAHAHDPEFAPAYDWLKRQMDARGLIRPELPATPWWCWIQYDGLLGQPKGDPGEDGLFYQRQVLLDLRIPASEVLPTLFHEWHYCLNGWPLYETIADANRFEIKLRKHGLSPYRDKPLPQPFQAEMEKGWERVLDLDFQFNDGEPDTPFADRTIQGVFWTLKPEYIVAVTPAGEPADFFGHLEEECAA
ncbi:DUF3841 domain-containing protein [Pseudomonas aeruginosa]